MDGGNDEPIYLVMDLDALRDLHFQTARALEKETYLSNVLNDIGQPDLSIHSSE